MKDTKIKSLVEAAFNIVVGISISFVANLLILPLFGFKPTIGDLALIGVIYTFISLARTYIIRRLFVNGFYEEIKRK